MRKSSRAKREVRVLRRIIINTVGAGCRICAWIYRSGKCALRQGIVIARIHTFARNIQLLMIILFRKTAHHIRTLHIPVQHMICLMIPIRVYS